MCNNGVVYLDSPEVEKCIKEEEHAESVCFLTSDGAFS